MIYWELYSHIRRNLQRQLSGIYPQTKSSSGDFCLDQVTKRICGVCAFSYWSVGSLFRSLPLVYIVLSFLLLSDFIAYVGWSWAFQFRYCSVADFPTYVLWPWLNLLHSHTSPFCLVVRLHYSGATLCSLRILHSPYGLPPHRVTPPLRFHLTLDCVAPRPPTFGCSLDTSLSFPSSVAHFAYHHVGQVVRVPFSLIPRGSLPHPSSSILEAFMGFSRACLYLVRLPPAHTRLLAQCIALFFASTHLPSFHPLEYSPLSMPYLFCRLISSSVCLPATCVSAPHPSALGSILRATFLIRTRLYVTATGWHAKLPWLLLRFFSFRTHNTNFCMTFRCRLF